MILFIYPQSFRKWWGWRTHTNTDKPIHYYRNTYIGIDRIDTYIRHIERRVKLN